MTHPLVSNGSRRSSAPSSFSARGAAIRPGELPPHEFNLVVFSEKASLNGYQLGAIKMADNLLYGKWRSGASSGKARTCFNWLAQPN